jgi:type IV pilus assembly protein PilB
MDSVVAQRLCRRLCAKCKQEYSPTEQELLDVGYPWDPGQPLPTLHRPVGCAACSRTGYRGRMALHEIMPFTEEIERLTVARSSTDDVARAALSAGMVPLRQDGWAKVALGETSIEEVLRVVV